MDDNTAKQLAQSLAFKVEAVPQESRQPSKVSGNVTPLNVKIRVRKKDVGKNGIPKGIIFVPKPGLNDSPSEKLRLASSDHTLLSFDMLMETEYDRKKKSRKNNFFGSCLGAQTDDDDGPYLPTTDSRSDSRIVKPNVLKKSAADEHHNDTHATSQALIRKNTNFFGVCKPGGCLDPPFGEDRYAYRPATLKQTEPSENVKKETKEARRESTANKPVQIHRESSVMVTADEYLRQRDSVRKSLSKEAGKKVTDDKLEQDKRKTAPSYTSNADKDGKEIPRDRKSSGLLSEKVKDKKADKKPEKSSHEFDTLYYSPSKKDRESIASSGGQKDSKMQDKVIADKQTKQFIDDNSDKNTKSVSVLKDSQKKELPSPKKLRQEAQIEDTTKVGNKEQDKVSLARGPITEIYIPPKDTSSNINDDLKRQKSGSAEASHEKPESDSKKKLKNGEEPKISSRNSHLEPSEIVTTNFPEPDDSSAPKKIKQSKPLVILTDEVNHGLVAENKKQENLNKGSTPKSRSERAFEDDKQDSKKKNDKRSLQPKDYKNVSDDRLISPQKVKDVDKNTRTSSFVSVTQIPAGIAKQSSLQIKDDEKFGTKDDNKNIESNRPSTKANDKFRPRKSSTISREHLKTPDSVEQLFPNKRTASKAEYEQPVVNQKLPFGKSGKDPEPLKHSLNDTDYPKSVQDDKKPQKLKDLKETTDKNQYDQPETAPKLSIKKSGKDDDTDYPKAVFDNKKEQISKETQDGNQYKQPVILPIKKSGKDDADSQPEPPNDVLKDTDYPKTLLDEKKQQISKGTKDNIQSNQTHFPKPRDGTVDFKKPSQKHGEFDDDNQPYTYPATEDVKTEKLKKSDKKDTYNIKPQLQPAIKDLQSDDKCGKTGTKDTNQSDQINLLQSCDANEYALDGTNLSQKYGKLDEDDKKPTKKDLRLDDKYGNTETKNPYESDQIDLLGGRDANEYAPEDTKLSPKYGKFDEDNRTSTKKDSQPEKYEKTETKDKNLPNQKYLPQSRDTNENYIPDDTKMTQKKIKSDEVKKAKLHPTKKDLQADQNGKTETKDLSDKTDSSRNRDTTEFAPDDAKDLQKYKKFDEDIKTPTKKDLRSDKYGKTETTDPYRSDQIDLPRNRDTNEYAPHDTNLSQKYGKLDEDNKTPAKKDLRPDKYRKADTKDPYQSNEIDLLRDPDTNKYAPDDTKLSQKYGNLVDEKYGKADTKDPHQSNQIDLLPDPDTIKYAPDDTKLSQKHGNLVDGKKPQLDPTKKALQPGEKYGKTETSDHHQSEQKDLLRGPDTNKYAPDDTKLSQKYGNLDDDNKQRLDSTKKDLRPVDKYGKIDTKATYPPDQIDIPHERDTNEYSPDDNKLSQKHGIIDKGNRTPIKEDVRPDKYGKTVTKNPYQLDQIDSPQSHDTNEYYRPDDGTTSKKLGKSDEENRSKLNPTKKELQPENYGKTETKDTYISDPIDLPQNRDTNDYYTPHDTKLSQKQLLSDEENQPPSYPTKKDWQPKKFGKPETKETNQSNKNDFPQSRGTISPRNNKQSQRYGESNNDNETRTHRAKKDSQPEKYGLLDPKDTHQYDSEKLAQGRESIRTLPHDNKLSQKHGKSKDANRPQIDESKQDSLFEKYPHPEMNDSVYQSKDKKMPMDNIKSQNNDKSEKDPYQSDKLNLSRDNADSLHRDAKLSPTQGLQGADSGYYINLAFEKFRQNSKVGIKTINANGADVTAQNIVTYRTKANTENEITIPIDEQNVMAIKIKPANVKEDDNIKTSKSRGNKERDVSHVEAPPSVNYDKDKNTISPDERASRNAERSDALGGKTMPDSKLQTSKRNSLSEERKSDKNNDPSVKVHISKRPSSADHTHRSPSIRSKNGSYKAVSPRRDRSNDDRPEIGKSSFDSNRNLPKQGSYHSNKGQERLGKNDVDEKTLKGHGNSQSVGGGNRTGSGTHSVSEERYTSPNKQDKRDADEKTPSRHGKSQTGGGGSRTESRTHSFSDERHASPTNKHDRSVSPVKKYSTDGVGRRYSHDDKSHGRTKSSSTRSSFILDDRRYSHDGTKQHREITERKKAHDTESEIRSRNTKSKKSSLDDNASTKSFGIGIISASGSVKNYSRDGSEYIMDTKLSFSEGSSFIPAKSASMRNASDLSFMNERRNYSRDGIQTRISPSDQSSFIAAKKMSTRDASDTNVVPGYPIKKDSIGRIQHEILDEDERNNYLQGDRRNSSKKYNRSSLQYDLRDSIDNIMSQDEFYADSRMSRDVVSVKRKDSLFSAGGRSRNYSSAGSRRYSIEIRQEGEVVPYSSYDRFEHKSSKAQESGNIHDFSERDYIDGRPRRHSYRDRNDNIKDVRYESLSDPSRRYRNSIIDQYANSNADYDNISFRGDKHADEREKWAQQPGTSRSRSMDRNAGFRSDGKTYNYEEGDRRMVRGSNSALFRLDDNTEHGKGAMSRFNPNYDRGGGRGRILRYVDGRTDSRMEFVSQEINRTLSFIYENELIPLQNVIKGLKDDIDILAQQQVMLREKLTGTKKIKGTRKCSCIKRIDFTAIQE